jgi:SAM-dependent methyltransferase
MLSLVRPGQRLRAAVRSPAFELFLWSRLAIWVVALFALLSFETSARNPEFWRWDAERLHDLGYAVDVWARWDSAWFVRIAEHGYSAPSSTPAFYPGYPSLVAGLGRLLFGHYVLAGVLVSLAACAVAFALLHRLALEKLGPAGAFRSVAYLAFFPMALFLQAVYSESLYLSLTLAAFLLAERGRFLGAGGLAGLAVLTRFAGLALLPALAVLAWRSPARKRALASLAVAPALFALYPLLLQQQTGKPLAFVDAQRDGWQRELSPLGPLGGLWDGLRAAVAGVRQLAVGRDGAVYWPVQGTDPLRVAALNLEQLAFTLAFIGLAVYAWRRFGAPYGLFALGSLAIPLSVPTEEWPLLSLPRFGLGIFPLFLALGALSARPRLHAALLPISATLLGVAVVQWVLWQWVA